MTYIKLNKTDNNGFFPVELAGYLDMGVELVPIFQPCQGTILLETNKSIVEGDQEVLAILGVKKLPNDVVVWI